MVLIRGNFNSPKPSRGGIVEILQNRRNRASPGRPLNGVHILV